MASAKVVEQAQKILHVLANGLHAIVELGIVTSEKMEHIIVSIVILNQIQSAEINIGGVIVVKRRSLRKVSTVLVIALMSMVITGFGMVPAVMPLKLKLKEVEELSVFKPNGL